MVPGFNFAGCNALAVAVSGGVDSMVLLNIFHENRDLYGIVWLIAVHVNHGLRGEESLRDEFFVRESCEKYGIECLCYQVDAAEFARTEKIGIEEAGRVLRYRIFEKVRMENGLDYISTAHNADDNAETVLMNLARGTGLEGLRGIPTINEYVIRPLIGVLRKDIEEYAKARGIKFVTDSTNASDDYTRNRVRNIIIPALSRYVNTSAVQNIKRCTEILVADADFIDLTARAVFEQIVLVGNNREFLRINVEGLSRQHVSIARRVVRLAINELMGSKLDISFKQVENILSLKNKQSGQRAEAAGVRAVREYDAVCFRLQQENSAGNSDAIPAKFEFPVVINRSVNLPQKNIKILISDMDKVNNSMYTYNLSVEAGQKPLKIRSRHPGDRIRLKSGDKVITKKIQDYFTDAKIPAAERDGVPLLVSGEEIIMILHKKGRISVDYSGEGLYVHILEV